MIYIRAGNGNPNYYSSELVEEIKDMIEKEKLIKYIENYLSCSHTRPDKEPCCLHDTCEDCEYNDRSTINEILEAALKYLKEG